MNFEPKQLTFRDVRLNQAYTTSLCITNPLTAAVEFTLRASSPRYSISPNRVVLNPNQSIVVTVRLFLNHYPNVQKGVQGQEDSIHIKSPYFDQKIQVDFYLHNQSVRSRSASPVERAVKAAAGEHSRSGTDLLSDLNAQLKVKDHRIEQLQNIVANLESKHPNLEEIVRAKIEKEREVFEEKSEKILKILRRKDEMVETLQRQLEESTRALQSHADASHIDADLGALAEGKSRDYWTGRSVSMAPGTGNTHRELVDMLEQTRNLLESEKQAHFNSRNELQNAYSKIEELNRGRGTDGGGSGNSRLQPQEWKELRGLREQAIDQAEEIKSLMGELGKLRRESQEQAAVGEDLQQAHREISRLRSDVAHQKKKYGELEAAHEALQGAHEALEQLHHDEHQRLRTLEAQHLQTQRGEHKQTHPRSGADDAMDSRSSGDRRQDSRSGAGGRVSWQGQEDHTQPARSSHNQSSRRDSSRERNGPSDRDTAQGHAGLRDAGGRQQDRHHDRPDSYHVDGSRFEESVGGGLATSTPASYALHPPETAQQAIQEKNNLISLYQDRMERYEEEIGQLKGRVSEGQGVEKELRDRLADVEAKLQGCDQEGRLLSERVERLKGEREATAHEVQDKEIQLQSALDRASHHEAATAVNDAHLWWAYIWHAMKQQQDLGPLPASSANIALNLGGLGGLGLSKPENHFISEVGASGPQTLAGTHGAPQPGNYDFKPAHEAGASVHDARLRDNLRSQAIEITQLRQELIGRKLTYKKEMDAIKEQNEAFQREIVRLQAQSRVHRADKDLKIAELAATVRTLSVRGDMHAQAAAARQEVEAEKLTNHHLRADVDSYRLMLEEEQRKVLTCRKEIANLQAQIDSSLVLQSVVNVPGVSPATLIELMAGEITQLESEVTKSRSSAAETTQQLRALQRTMSMAQQQRRQSVSDTPPNVTSASVANIAGPSPANPRRASVNNGPNVTAPTRARSLSPAGGRRATVGPGASTLRHSTSQVSLRSSIDGDFGEDLNQSVGDDDGFDQSPFKTSASPSRNNLGNAPFSVVVDGEATPKMVVESLDRAVLAQRVMSQEATIAELSALVEELQTAAMATDREHLIAKDSAEESDRIEWERSMRKQDLLQTLLDESRAEIKKLQQRNVDLEKSLSSVHAARMLEGFYPRAGAHHGAQDCNSVFFEDAPLMGNHTSDMGSYAGAEVNYEENLKELESTKILLRERTTQLKVIMETLDSLQLTGIKAGSKFHAEDEALFNRRPGSVDANLSTSLGEGFGGLNFSGGRGLTSMEGTWGMQALVKRVVELTTELTSQCAVASLEARRAEDLELTNRRQAKEINKQKVQMRNLEESAGRATLQLNTMCNQLQDGDRNHIEAMAALKCENEQLSTALRETEAALDASEIRVSSLVQQSELADKADFMGWLEFVTLDNQKIVTDSLHNAANTHSTTHGTGEEATGPHHNVVFNNMKIGESSVRDLVVSLVVQWKEYVGTVPQMKLMTSTATAIPKLSKAEQRFLQRVTDLVMSSNDRATKAHIDAQVAQARIKHVEHANQVAAERLQICASHLNRYRKRCHAFEKVLSVDRKHVGLKQGKLESLLRETVSDLRAKHSKAMDTIRAEKRDRMINEVKRAMEAQQLRKLQARIAELESRGTATLRARDEAVASLEGKLKNTEECMHKWFKVELPRLVSGLPATEDTLASYYNENTNPNYGVDPSPFGASASGDSHAPISMQLLSSLGMDRTYALSQALCSSKAAMTVQEMRISGLTEKLSILKERNLALEGVIIRWKDEIQQSTIAATVPSVGHNAAGMMQHLRPDEFNQDGLDQYIASIPGVASGSAQGHVATMGNANRVDAAIQQVYQYAEAEIALNNKVQELSQRLIELEEENIEMRGKFEQANARAGEMKALVDVVMGDEQQLKTKATQQLTKIRLNLEKEHAEELRKIRQSYESEKNKLLGELEAVANAVEEAKITSVDTTAWQRLVAGGEDESKAGERFYGTQPRPTPIRNYVPTPPYENSDRKGLDFEAAEERKETRKKSKKSHTKKGKKHRRKHHESSSSSNNDSSSSSSSSSSDSDDSLHDGKGGKSGDRRGRSTQRRRDPEETDDRDGAPASASDALNTSAADAYAHTLRGNAVSQAQQQAQQAPPTAPRPRARTAARDPMDVRPTPSSVSESSNASVSLSYINQQQDLAEVQVENLERLLEMERRRHEETKFEMAELQQLLQIQQSVFREHLGAQPGGAQPSAAAPVLNNTHPRASFAAPIVSNNQNRDTTLSTFNDDSFSTPSSSPSENDQQNQARSGKGTTNRAVNATSDTLQGILREVQREDSALWPSLSTLVDELMNVLQGLSTHTRSEDDRTDARTALAMAARIKTVCSTSSEARNIAGSAAEAKNKAQTSFHAEQLLEELNRYSAPAAPKQRPQDDSSVTSINFKTLASFGNSAGAPSSTDTKDYSGHLQSLANRVKMMESDFKDDNIPERHLYLMRDLRMRVLELEKTLSEELLSQQNKWAAERAALTRKAQENADLAEQSRRGQSESMSTMRQRYEEALRNAEEALESSTRAATQEVTRLELLLAQQASDKAQLQARLQAELAKPQAATAAPTAPAVRSAGSSISSATAQQPSVARPVVAPTATAAPPVRAPSPALVPPSAPETSSVATVPAPLPPAPPAGASADALNEFLRMQRLVDQTGDHLEHTRQQRQQIEMYHAREVAELKSHFTRFRRAQAEVVQSLEDQLEDLHEQLSAAQTGAAAGTRNSVNRANVDDSLAGGRSMATQLNSIAEAEDVIRKMEFKYRIKTAELEAVMRTLSRMATGDANDTMASEDQSSLGGNTTYTFDVPDMSVRPLHPPTSRYGGSVSAYSNNNDPRSSREGRAHGGEADDFGVLNNEHFDSVARDMQTELYEARIITCEKEIEALHRNLQKERMLVASLKAQLQASQEQSQQTTAAGTKAAPRSTSAGSVQRIFQSVDDSSMPAPASAPVAPAGEQPKARITSRRGSTGSIVPAGSSSGIPTFAPAAPSARAPTTAGPSAGTGVAAGPPASGAAAADVINDFTQDYVVPENPNDPEKTRLLVRRMNEMRRTARVEISRLKEQIIALKTDLTEDDGSKTGTVADLKMQLAQLKEENSRKTKLVSALKSAKTAEDNSLEQWKFEVGQLEENCKRLQRAVSSKEAMIKDLKAKVEGLENAMALAQREGVVPTANMTSAHAGHGAHAAPTPTRGLGSPGGVPTADISTMAAPELRTRLRASELERARNRTRLQALKEKVTELETEVGRLQDENTKLQKLGERAESVKGAVLRKDGIIQQLKGQVEKLQLQIDNFKTTELMLQSEVDKKDKQLQRRVEAAEASKRELEHESQLMRQRLTDAATREQAQIEVRRSSDTGRRFTDNTASTPGSSTPFSGAPARDRAAMGNTAASHGAERSTTPSRATAVQQRRASVSGVASRDAIGSDQLPPRRSSAATAGTSQQISGVPAPLSAATNDLQDVINALGVSPLHLGLGVNPRSSAVRDAYTHNSFGRGSTMDRENLMSPGETSTSSGEGAGGAEVSSVEKRFKALVNTALRSPVRQRRL